MFPDVIVEGELDDQFDDNTLLQHLCGEIMEEVMDLSGNQGMLKRGAMCSHQSVLRGFRGDVFAPATIHVVGFCIVGLACLGGARESTEAGFFLL